MPSLTSRTADLAGGALAAVTRVVAVRPAAKPLHPRGSVGVASLVRHGHLGTGAAWLDEPGTHEALVRFSAAVGLPRGLPDVQGLALRALIPGGREADLLLATTGRGRLTRYLLRPGFRPERMFHGSLLPYRTPAGPVVLGARPRPDGVWDLVAAVGLGPWASYGELVVGATRGDQDVTFDPVLNPLPGLEQYDAVRRLRLPAYRSARRSRDE
jgi:hypothetical protein